jgi:hypothetical protein
LWGLSEMKRVGDCCNEFEVAEDHLKLCMRMKIDIAD